MNGFFDESKPKLALHVTTFAIAISALVASTALVVASLSRYEVAHAHERQTSVTIYVVDTLTGTVCETVFRRGQSPQRTCR